MQEENYNAPFIPNFPRFSSQFRRNVSSLSSLVSFHAFHHNQANQTWITFSISKFISTIHLPNQTQCKEDDENVINPIQETCIQYTHNIILISYELLSPTYHFTTLKIKYIINMIFNLIVKYFFKYLYWYYCLKIVLEIYVNCSEYIL